MGSDNGDLVREATMRRVRRHIRAGIEIGRDPADLTDEVIRTYDLSSAEAGLAKTMVLGAESSSVERRRREQRR